MSMVNTHPLGQVSRIDPAMVCFDAPSAEREAEAQACSIGAALLERTEELAGVLNRQASALVLDLDQDALGAGADPEGHAGVRSRELDGVLQEVSHHRGEDRAIRLDQHVLSAGYHAEREHPGRVLRELRPARAR